MEDLVPSEYYLSQNYPDPFKEKTTIKYCLPENTKVKLELFDSNKNKIKTLVDETKKAGTYQVLLNGKELHTGYYYCKMQAGSYEEMKKIRIER